jgi:hypothetical protein
VIPFPRTRRTEEFGAYTCNSELMLRELGRLSVRVRAETSYDACAVRVNPVDARELARAMFPGTDGAINRVLDLWVFQDDTVRPGIAEVLQCPLPHRHPQDCVYHARTRRRFVKTPGP